MSEERRQEQRELTTQVTRLTTLFEENFDRESGHFTVMMRDMKKKVDAHDSDIKFAKGALAVLGGLYGLGLAWIKTHIGSK